MPDIDFDWNICMNRSRKLFFLLGLLGIPAVGTAQALMHIGSITPRPTDTPCPPCGHPCPYQSISIPFPKSYPGKHFVIRKTDDWKRYVSMSENPEETDPVDFSKQMVVIMFFSTSSRHARPIERINEICVELDRIVIKDSRIFGMVPPLNRSVVPSQRKNRRLILGYAVAIPHSGLPVEFDTTNFKNESENYRTRGIHLPPILMSPDEWKKR